MEIALLLSRSSHSDEQCLLGYQIFQPLLSSLEYEVDWYRRITPCNENEVQEYVGTIKSNQNEKSNNKIAQQLISKITKLILLVNYNSD